MTDSATEQAALVRDGHVSARELVEAALAAIERADPQLNAFVTLCGERALAEADAVMPGDPRPLAGVPVGIKDLITLTGGIRTTQGSRATGDWAPGHDSPAVARLRAAGAIVVGKTNTPEFGLRPVTEPERFGPARNPWDPSLTPGGSSGGSAAAVAAGMVALAHGNDAGGSIRIPASNCGLVGLKPSRFRVPIDPEFAELAALASDGVLTRTVLDTAVALDALSGEEHPGPLSVPPPPVPFADSARTPPGSLKIRVTVVPPVGVPVDPECAHAVQVAADALSDLGHDVEEETPDWLGEDFQGHWEIAISAAMQGFFDALGHLMGGALDVELLEPATREMMAAPRIPPSALLVASERLQDFVRRVIGSWPAGSLLLTPALARLPARVGGLPPSEGVRCSAFTRVFNVTGQPAISLPLHRTAAGIPVGVQLAAPVGRESRLLSLAGQLEQTALWPTTAPPAG
ncbi:MAG: amidase [Solirubrobacteraceae bacterium]